MNRFVKEHYPTDQLPADLRDALIASPTVRIVIEEEVQPIQKAHGLSQFIGALAHMQTSSEEAVARIRALRDE
jgi:hypothetical protein